jgi:hypothetical protein
MRRSPLVVQALVVGALIALPNEDVRAQVGLQVRSGNTWGAVAEMSTPGPVSLRWKWDGVGIPTRVTWQLTTQPPASTGAPPVSNPVSAGGGLNLPGKSGAYEQFSVTPPPSVRFPFYIRVRADVVVKGDAGAEKGVFSRWITVRELARAAPVPTVSTAPTRAAPVTSGLSEPQKTAGVAVDPTRTAGVAVDATPPLRITLARIQTKATARTDYESKGPGAIGARAPLNRIYVMMVAIELNRSNLEQSLVRVQATPVYPVTTNSTVQAHVPLWGPYSGAARPIAGTGGDVLLMMALMQRYGSRELGISEALILKGIREQLSLIKGIDPGDVKQVLLKRFAQDNEAAARQDRIDRPVAYNVWSRILLLTKLNDNLLQRAREGEIIELTQDYGAATGLASTGGQFTVVFDMRR